MLPVLEGLIARRILVNFRLDSEGARRILPAPFEPEIRNGYAVAGVCLIRLERMRLKGLPTWTGLSLESAAHRIAVRQPDPQADGHGVYIFRRETDSRLTEITGGRVFPSRFGRADFQVDAGDDRVCLAMRTSDGTADVSFKARIVDHWTPTTLFQSLDDATRFFERGDCGWAPSTQAGCFDGMQLVTPPWEAEPLSVEQADLRYFADTLGVPAGAMTFDSAFLIRDLTHEWVALPPMTEKAADLKTEVRATDVAAVA